MLEMQLKSGFLSWVVSEMMMLYSVTSECLVAVRVSELMVVLCCAVNEYLLHVVVWRQKVRSCWRSTAVLLSTTLGSETTSLWLVRRDWLRAVPLNRFLLTFFYLYKYLSVYFDSGFHTECTGTKSVQATAKWKLLRWSTQFILMATLRSRCGHYIFALWFVSSSFFFFLASPQWSQIGCVPYLHTWCGPSANLECMSEMRCMWLAENTGRKKSPSGHHHTTLSSYIFAIKADIDNRKKTC